MTKVKPKSCDVCANRGSDVCGGCWRWIGCMSYPDEFKEADE